MNYWFEHELRQYPAVDLDFDALKPHADRVMPMGGRESHGHPAYEATVALGKKLGREVTELLGGHVGVATQAPEFTRDLIEALAKAGHVPKT